ncbi:MAG: DUF4097 family beta strand repeat-containing protein [Candidatus Zixiibacteriota bacterium]
MNRHIIATLAISAIIVMMTAAGADAKLFRFEDSYEYEVKNGFELNVSNTSGDISVNRQSGDKVIVKVIKQVDASSRDEAEEKEDRVEVSIKADKDKIDIDTRYPRRQGSDGFWGKLFGLDKGYNGSVSYEIEVPVELDLFIATTSGDVLLGGLEGNAQIGATSSDITIRDHKGDCDIDNTSGNIVLRDVKGNVNVNSTSSDALFDNIQGDVDLQATSGDTEANWISGSIRVSKTSGYIRIAKSSGDIDINAISGDIEIEQKEGGFTLTTSSGDITVVSEFCGGARYEAETISGNIYVRVPNELKSDVRLETVSGNIDTDLALEVKSFNRNRLEGRVRGGGTGIYLTSTSGDISLEEY